MHVGMLGINYRSSGLDLREILAKAVLRCFGNESRDAARLFAVPLLTCNRTELYFGHPDLPVAHTEILQILEQEISVPFSDKLYSFFGGECFGHLATVTSGLDSVIVGETEIQRQVKLAYEAASLHRTLNPALHYMFQKALKVGKLLRTSLSFSSSFPSLEKTVYHLSSFFGNDEVLFVGNSEINRKIIEVFQAKDVKNITLCTRSLHSAEEMAKEKDLKLLEWKQLTEWKQYSVVICATNQQEYLIHPESIGSDYQTRLLIDLSLPRNVDPRVGRHSKIQLMNIEQIGHIVEKKRLQFAEEIAFATKRVKEEVQRQVMLFQNKRTSCATS